MKLPTTDVFKTVGLPPYTYVKPKRFGEIRLDVGTAGKHLLIEGPSGIGKTCVVYKVFEELSILKKDFTYLSCRDIDAVERVREAMALSLAGVASGHYYFIDDFHLLPSEMRNEIGEQLKRISDAAFEEAHPVKMILVGIPTAGESLLYNAKDLGPRIGIYKFSTAEPGDIARVLQYGEERLNIKFSDSNAIIYESSGNFWLAQHLSLKICATSNIYESSDETIEVKVDIGDARSNLLEELHAKYRNVVATFARGKKWRPGGNKPYLDIILSIARRGEPVQTFEAVKSGVEASKRPGINAVRKRIPEVLHDPTREIDLRKQLFFDPNGSFSIEDPLFLYYLKHLDTDQLFRELGISNSKSEEFEYDVGFSFSGAVREFVEIINGLLQSEDVVTFYDYDHQAFLLGQNLEVYFEEIYSKGCRFYLVFINEDYREKVWPSLERGFMTKANRKDHIIPVIMTKTSKAVVLGIPSATGHIDISDLSIDSPDLLIKLKERVSDLIVEKINN